MSYNPSLDHLITIQNDGVPLQIQPGISINAAATWAFYYWKQIGSLTLTSFKLGTGDITGTTTNILSWDLRNSDILGGVGSSITTGTITPVAFTPSGGTLSQALTDGNYYGFLVKNVAGTPASNNFQMNSPHVQIARPGWGQYISYDSGTTWDDDFPHVPNLQLGYGDGSRAGQCWMRGTQGAGITTVPLYSSFGIRKALSGIRFRPIGRYFLHRVHVATRLNGTFASAGSLVAEVYAGTTLIATSNTRTGSASTSGNRGQSFYFSTPVLLEPDTDYVVAITQSTSSGGSSSHNWYILGAAYATSIPPTGTADAGPWGIHSVYSTASPLSAWTISPNSDQYYMGLGLSPAVRA